MTNNLTTKPQTNIELWQSGIFDNAIEHASQELGYNIPIERLSIQPDLLPEDEQQAIELYESTVISHAKLEWSRNEDRCRRIQARISQYEQERKALWRQVKNHQEVIEKGKEKLADMPDGSTQRTIAAFYNRYYDNVIDAGVDPEQVAELATRPDKFMVNAERAIAKTVKNDDLTQDEKRDKIKSIVDDAVNFEHASDIRKRYLNGQIKIPRDILWLDDGTRLVTFVCDDDQAFLELDKYTGNIVSEYGNTEQILLSTKDERTRQNVLTQFKVALAIIQSGESLPGDIDQDIVQILIDYGYVKEN